LTRSTYKEMTTSSTGGPIAYVYTPTNASSLREIGRVTEATPRGCGPFSGGPRRYPHRGNARPGHHRIRPHRCRDRHLVFATMHTNSAATPSTASWTSFRRAAEADPQAAFHLPAGGALPAALRRREGRAWLRSR
jgi:hypothetical protein